MGSPVNKVQRLKELVQRMSDAPLLQKGAIAEKALNQAINVIDDQEGRLSKLELFVRRDWEEMSVNFNLLNDRIIAIKIMVDALDDRLPKPIENGVNDG